MNIIHGLSKTGKTKKILEEYGNREDSIIISSYKSLFNCPIDSDNINNIIRVESFYDQYIDNIRARNKKDGCSFLLKNTLLDYYYRNKMYNNIIVDIDINYEDLIKIDLGQDLERLVITALSKERELKVS